MTEIDIEQIKDIAREAGNIILGIYNNIDEDLVIDKKADDSPLTQADQAANTYICAELEKLYPNIPIISEENKMLPYEEREDWEEAWLVDPLDGTKEFIKRNGEFTVNIALIRKGNCELGVLYAPVIDEMYYGDKGKGAFLESNGEKRALTVPEASSSDSGLRIVASRSHINEETQTYISQFKDPEITSKGSSLKFMLIAKGDADIYPRIAPTMEWDTGAAQAILEEAGGRVIRYDDRLKLEYNKENLLNPYFIAMAKITED